MVMKQGLMAMRRLSSRLHLFIRLLLFAVQHGPDLVIRGEVPSDAITRREAVLHLLVEERLANTPGDFVDGNSAFLGSGAYDFDIRVKGHVRYLVAVRERHEDVCAGPWGDVER